MRITQAFREWEIAFDSGSRVIQRYYNLRAEYSLFDRQTGRPLARQSCDTCKRYTATGMQTLPCPAPELRTGEGQACKPMGV
jgi:hypothetical protein